MAIGYWCGTAGVIPLQDGLVYCLTLFTISAKIDMKSNMPLLFYCLVTLRNNMSLVFHCQIPHLIILADICHC